MATSSSSNKGRESCRTVEPLRCGKLATTPVQADVIVADDFVHHELCAQLLHAALAAEGEDFRHLDLETLQGGVHMHVAQNLVDKLRGLNGYYANLELLRAFVIRYRAGEGHAVHVDPACFTCNVGLTPSEYYDDGELCFESGSREDSGPEVGDRVEVLVGAHGQERWASANVLSVSRSRRFEAFVSCMPEEEGTLPPYPEYNSLRFSSAISEEGKSWRWPEALRLRHEAGRAVLHRGSLRHYAEPLGAATRCCRCNLIVWCRRVAGVSHLWVRLPASIHALVVEHLHVRDLCALAAVSHECMQLVAEASVWQKLLPYASPPLTVCLAHSVFHIDPAVLRALPSMSANDARWRCLSWFWRCAAAAEWCERLDPGSQAWLDSAAEWLEKLHGHARIPIEGLAAAELEEARWHAVRSRIAAKAKEAICWAVTPADGVETQPCSPRSCPLGLSPDEAHAKSMVASMPASYRQPWIEHYLP
jgi:hypothetical protein